MMPQSEPEELWAPDSELPVKVKNLLDFEAGCGHDIGEVAEGAPPIPSPN